MGKILDPETTARTRSVELRVLPDGPPRTPRTPLPHRAVPADTAATDASDRPGESRPRVSDGDPFSPYRILNHFDKLQKIAAGETVVPITVEIDPSNRCNHRCAWCVSLESHTGERLEFDRYLELVKELEHAGTESVVLKGGGEPTLHPRIGDMLRAAVDVGLKVGLITNGSMPHRGTRLAVVECVDWVRVSLDAAEAGTHEQIHGTRDFERIIDNVAWLSAHVRKTLVGLNFVAEPRNHDQIRAFAEMGKRLGVAYVTIRCVFDPDHPPPASVRQTMRQQSAAADQLGDEDFRVFLGNFTDEYLDARPDQPFPFERCLGPNLVGVVGADGEVYACCFLRGDRRFSFGNINDEGFEEIWSGERRRDVMEAVYRGECGHVCTGGMTANRYNIYNRILNYMALEHKQHSEFA